MNELWLDANRPMFGDSVQLSDDYGWWWLYIPHFVHSPFYCYAYAFGELLVLALLRRYDEEGPALRAALPRAAARGRLRHARAICSRASGSTSPIRTSGTAGSRCSRDLVAQAETLAG